MAKAKLHAGKAGSRLTPVVQVIGDAGSQIVQLCIDRFYGGVDLAPLKWCVVVENPAGETDVYMVDNVCSDDCMIHMDWRIGSTATAKVGTTKFKVEGINDNDAVVWQSGIYHIRVDDTITYTPGSEVDTQLTGIQQMIVYVEGELQNVIKAGQDANAAADAANKAVSEVEQAAETAINAVNDAAQAVATANSAVNEAAQAAETANSAADLANRVVQDANNAANDAVRAAEAANSAADLANDVVQNANNAANDAVRAAEAANKAAVLANGVVQDANNAANRADAAAEDANDAADRANDAADRANDAADRLEGTGGGSSVTVDATLSIAGQAADAAAVGEALRGKVNAVAGMGLSANDYTDAEKATLARHTDDIADLNDRIDDIEESGGSGSGASPEQIAQIERNRVDIVDIKTDVTELSNAISEEISITDDVVEINTYEGAALNVVTNIVPIQSGSGVPSPSNIMPISGHASASITMCGKNIISNEGVASVTENGVSFTKNADGSIRINGTASASAVYTIHRNSLYVPNGKYIISGVPSGDASTFYVTFYDGENKEVRYDIGAEDTVVDIVNGCITNFRLVVWQGTTVDNVTFYPMIRSADVTDRTYEPYLPSKTYTSNFTHTVYGGALDWNEGVLTEKWGIIESYAGESLHGKWISDRDVYTEGGTPSNGAQVVYELAEPVEMQLTGRNIYAAQGVNTIYGNAGKTIVTYQNGIAAITQYLLERIKTLKDAIISLGGNV